MPRSLLWPDPRVKPPFGAAEIDWGHPLAVGLLNYFLFNEGGGRLPMDLRIGGSVLGGAGTPVWTTTANGLGISFTTADDLDVFSTAELNALGSTTSSYSVATLCGIANTGVSVRVSAKSTLSPDLHTWSFGKLATNKAVWIIYDGTNVPFVTSTMDVNDSVQRAYVGVRNVPTDALMLYINGALDGSVTDTTTATCATSGGFEINAERNAARATSTMTYHGVWGRALTASEAQWLAAEPYAMLRPIVRRRYFVPAAAVAAAEGAHGAMYPRMQRHIHQSWTVPR